MNPVQAILIFAVRVYRWTLSPVLQFVFGPRSGCRFTPTCSAYALEALQFHGALSGSWLAVRRVFRCHPWGGCGHDPVPGKRKVDTANTGCLRVTAGVTPGEQPSNSLNAQLATLKPSPAAHGS